MDYYKFRSDKDFQGLIEMGLSGHYPIFHTSWLKELNEVTDSAKEKSKVTLEKKKMAENIFEKLKAHRSYDRQQTVLMALPKEERTVFINAFLKIVENKILDQGRQLQ